MAIIILVVCLFQFVYGIPRVMDQGERYQLIRHYFDIGYTLNEIIAFLLCKHGIAVSLPQLKRILRRTGLLKNNNTKPVIEIVQRTVSLHQQRFFFYSRIQSHVDTVKWCMQNQGNSGVCLEYFESNQSKSCC